MRSKKGLNLSRMYSSNFSLHKRHERNIKFIIIHYTGMKKESAAIKKLCNPKSKVSSHYYIQKSGNILNLVPDLYEAWHAGKSNWKKYKLLNKYSLGIEMTNPGHQHGYKKFSKNQIISIRKLLKYLMKKYKIEKQNILGHSDISPERKRDPGENFPWKTLAKSNLSIWHKLNTKIIKKFRKIKLSSKKYEEKFINNLNKLGYVKIDKKKSSKNTKLLVTAFQRRFRQDLINGKIDEECFLISKNLLIS